MELQPGSMAARLREACSGLGKAGTAGLTRRAIMVAEGSSSCSSSNRFGATSTSS